MLGAEGDHSGVMTFRIALAIALAVVLAGCGQVPVKPADTPSPPGGEGPRRSRSAAGAVRAAAAQAETRGPPRDLQRGGQQRARAGTALRARARREDQRRY